MERKILKIKDREDKDMAMLFDTTSLTDEEIASSMLYVPPNRRASFRPVVAGAFDFRVPLRPCEPVGASLRQEKEFVEGMDMGRFCSDERESFLEALDVADFGPVEEVSQSGVEISPCDVVSRAEAEEPRIESLAVEGLACAVEDGNEAWSLDTDPQQNEPPLEEVKVETRERNIAPVQETFQVVSSNACESVESLVKAFSSRVKVLEFIMPEDIRELSVDDQRRRMGAYQRSYDAISQFCRDLNERVLILASSFRTLEECYLDPVFMSFNRSLHRLLVMEERAQLVRLGFLTIEAQRPHYVSSLQSEDQPLRCEPHLKSSSERRTKVDADNRLFRNAVRLASSRKNRKK